MSPRGQLESENGCRARLGHFWAACHSVCLCLSAVVCKTGAYLPPSGDAGETEWAHVGGMLGTGLHTQWAHDRLLFVFLLLSLLSCSQARLVCSFILPLLSPLLFQASSGELDQMWSIRDLNQHPGESLTCCWSEFLQRLVSQPHHITWKYSPNSPMPLYSQAFLSPPASGKHWFICWPYSYIFPRMAYKWNSLYSWK